MFSGIEIYAYMLLSTFFHKSAINSLKEFLQILNNMTSLYFSQTIIIVVVINLGYFNLKCNQLFFSVHLVSYTLLCIKNSQYSVRLVNVSLYTISSCISNHLSQRISFLCYGLCPSQTPALKTPVK